MFVIIITLFVLDSQILSNQQNLNYLKEIVIKYCKSNYLPFNN